MEELVKIMVERWSLPEHALRRFLSPVLGANSDTPESPLTLEQLRDLVSSFLQDTIVQSLTEKKDPS